MSTTQPSASHSDQYGLDAVVATQSPIAAEAIDRAENLRAGWWMIPGALVGVGLWGLAVWAVFAVMF